MSFYYGIFALIYLLTLLCFPAQSLQTTQEALSLFTARVLPSLLPFFVGAQLLTQSTVLSRLGALCGRPAQALLRCPGTALPAVALSYLSGFPTGAKTLAALYRNGALTADELFRAVSAAACLGPGFVVSAVGMSLPGGASDAMLLAVSHYAGALLNGILWSMGAPRRNTHRPENKQTPPAITQALSDALAQSGTAMLGICATVVFFLVVARVTLRGFLPAVLLLEITGACQTAAALPLPPAAAHCLLSVLLGFGGLSLAMQSLPFFADIPGFSAGKYLSAQLTHGLCSGVLSLLCHSARAAWPCVLGIFALALWLLRFIPSRQARAHSPRSHQAYDAPAFPKKP